MTKQGFIQELNSALSRMEAQIREEIISDINEHFIEGASQGLSEEEICRNLGQPGSIAEQALEEYAKSAASRGSQSSRSAEGGFEISIDETFSGVNDIEVKMNVSGIRFVPMPQSNDVRVVIEGRSRYEKFTVENQNGKLIVQNNMPLLQFGFFNANVKLETTIYVPHSFCGDINASSSAGGVHSTGIGGNLTLKSSAGMVTVEDYRGDNVYINSSAGDVKLQIADSAAPEVKMKTSAGSAVLTAGETKQLSISSSAGSVKVDVKKICGDVKLHSSAGSVKLTALDATGNIDVTTSAGSVEVCLPVNIDCRIEPSKPSFGKLVNELTGNPNSQYRLRAKSSVGTVKLKAI